MPRKRRTDDDVRKNNASLRTMLSDVRGERDDATVALEAVLTTIEGTEYDEKARSAAQAAIEKRRTTADRGPTAPSAAGGGEPGTEGGAV